MGFLDDLKVAGADLLAKSNVFAKEAAQKAQDAASMAKIKLDIAAREREIKELYAKIGKAYYEEYKHDAVEFAEDIQEITAKYAVISELKSKYEMYKEAMHADKEEETADESVSEEAEDAIIIVSDEDVTVAEAEEDMEADYEFLVDSAEKIAESDTQITEETV